MKAILRTTTCFFFFLWFCHFTESSAGFYRSGKPPTSAINFRFKNIATQKQMKEGSVVGGTVTVGVNGSCKKRGCLLQGDILSDVEPRGCRLSCKWEGLIFSMVIRPGNAIMPHLKSDIRRQRKGSKEGWRRCLPGWP